MSNESDTPELRTLGLEPDDLDGHTIEELADYVDSGRTPRDPSIESSPGCRIALDALEGLRGLSAELLATDAEAEPPTDDAWVQRILADITLDARAGRRIPLDTPADHVDLGITEGAVRGLIRSAEASVPGLFVGRCRLEGDVTDPAAAIRITVDVSAPYGQPVRPMIDRLREEISRRLSAHTQLTVLGIDIVVQDLYLPLRLETGKP